jgi:hypothetical protein
LTPNNDAGSPFDSLEKREMSAQLYCEGKSFGDVSIRAIGANFIFVRTQHPVLASDTPVEVRVADPNGGSPWSIEGRIVHVAKAPPNDRSRRASGYTVRVRKQPMRAEAGSIVDAPTPYPAASAPYVQPPVDTMRGTPPAVPAAHPGVGTSGAYPAMAPAFDPNQTGGFFQMQPQYPYAPAPTTGAYPQASGYPPGYGSYPVGPTTGSMDALAPPTYGGYPPQAYGGYDPRMGSSGGYGAADPNAAPSYPPPGGPGGFDALAPPTASYPGVASPYPQGRPASSGAIDALPPMAPYGQGYGAPPGPPRTGGQLEAMTPVPGAPPPGYGAPAPAHGYPGPNPGYRPPAPAHGYPGPGHAGANQTGSFQMPPAPAYGANQTGSFHLPTLPTGGYPTANQTGNFAAPVPPPGYRPPPPQTGAFDAPRPPPGYPGYNAPPTPPGGHDVPRPTASHGASHPPPGYPGGRPPTKS